jgi:hypothetical protein
MRVHLLAVAAYCAGMLGVCALAGTRAFPWWGALQFLLGGVLVDFAWHTANHKGKPVWTTVKASGWLPVVTAVVLLLSGLQTGYIALLIILWGQAFWDLGWHAALFHPDQPAAGPSFRIGGLLMVAIGNVLPFLQAYQAL